MSMQPQEAANIFHACLVLSTCTATLPSNIAERHNVCTSCIYTSLPLYRKSKQGRRQPRLHEDQDIAQVSMSMNE